MTKYKTPPGAQEVMVVSKVAGEKQEHSLDKEYAKRTYIYIYIYDMCVCVRWEERIST